ncbi:MAG TPA: carboxypeptidase M32 [Tepidisphaeraceae bacterium]|nr:carboxypeptidase M32 [Tepidisphaeraceae bacterium]
MDLTSAYDELISTTREIGLLNSVESVLGWDERVMMPDKGAEHRANQMSLLARLTHQQLTSPRIGELLAQVEGTELVRDPESDASVNVREIRRAYDRATKVPTRLVEELTKTGVLGQQAWVDARKRSDFPTFRPWLEKMVDLKREEATCVGFKTHPYDALLDDYEPGDTTADVTRVFESLRAPLIDLVGRIAQSGKTAPVELFERNYPADAQQRFARDAAETVGFDFTAGRLDVSVHPFCTQLGPGDVRMTTRYNEGRFGAFFGVLHETGHGLYSQGLDPAHFGTPRGQYISLGIHESQSRLYENFIGRSRSFWHFFYPRAKQAFPLALHDVSVDQWLFANNDVRPGFIRVEADEATYNLHILLRFELEQALVSADLSPKDVPGAWNERMRHYLGLTPPDDARGCLQDIHWSSGGIGYFPTYTLGNLYAAQFFEQARKDLGDLDEQFARGQFAPLLRWLNESIHRHGRRYTARQLVKRVTGRELSAEPLLNHLRRKASEFYGITPSPSGRGPG